MIRFFLGIFGALFTFLSLGAIMGTIMVGGVFWAFSRDLPDYEQLRSYAPKTISRIYSTEGHIMDEFARERRLFTPIEEIPDLVKAAFISAEDKNFYNHKGYDPRGMVVAAMQCATGARCRGASTITQQVMKNFLLSSDRSAERKIKELILASRLEKSLDKDHILELYLNEIELGARSFGVTAAAQTYFNKNLSDLTVAEAAYLGGLPQDPYDLHPVEDRDRAILRRNFVLKEMHENGYITKAQYDEALLDPLDSVQGGQIPSYREDLPTRDYFTDEIRRQLSRNFGEDEFFEGGLSIRATMDPELQAEAAKALRDGLEKYDRAQGVWRGTGKVIEAGLLGDEASWRKAIEAMRLVRDVPGWYPAVVLSTEGKSATIGIDGVSATEADVIPAEDVTWARKRLADGKLSGKAKVPSDLVDVGDIVYVRAITKDEDGSFVRWSLRQVPEVQGAFMAMDVDSGRVYAMQGGFSYEASVYNRATQAYRQPGSAFKPFVYAAALDSGFSPASIVIDAPIEVDTPQGLWKPQNSSNKYYGPAPLRTGLEQSRNLMTVRLAQETGMDVVASYGERFGVYDHMDRFLSAALGSEETTLFRVVSAYAMFANGGQRVEPTLVDRVQDRWGRTIYRHDQRECDDCQVASLDPRILPAVVSHRDRVVDAITAYQITSMLQGVVTRGTAASAINLPVPVAGKTGTTNEAKDVWFVGFSSTLVAGCYIGFDQPKTLGNSAFGGTLCAPVFQAFMTKAVKKYGGTDFPLPPGGHFIKIDRFSGARLSDDASGDSVVAEYFRDGEEPVFGITYDGGFAMGVNLPLFQEGESDEGRSVTTSDGGTGVLTGKANASTLGSGGLY
ncbi:MAG: penicillin-binding protein 1A [Deltaproteobacteria bacterium]